jgi:sec-independent protein translocase protein TatC
VETDAAETVEESRMSFFDHLEELRRRLIRCVVVILLTSSGCLIFGEELFTLLSSPIVKLLPKGTALVFTSLPDPFFIYLKVAFIAGLFLAIPYILYELWQFIRPGLFPNERSLALPFVILAAALFYLGGAFAYFLVFPAAFKFFLGYSTPELQPMIAIREYVSLVMMLMLAFGAVFETPIIVVFLGLLNIFTSTQLRKGRRYFIVIAFIIGAILTPTPDPFNQTLMAVPMLLLYELGIRFLIILEKRRQREKEREETEEKEQESL